eukprot:jgi/Chrzof1/2593/Cz11g21160.t1
MGSWQTATSLYPYRDGICANPEGPEHKDRPWCYVDYLTCKKEPAGVTDESRELHWDYCTQASDATHAPAVTPHVSPINTTALQVVPHLTDAIHHPLYHTTYQGQNLVTACPCLDQWNYTYGNGTVETLSGCANPEQSFQASIHILPQHC